VRGGELIREARTRAGLSQMELSRLTGRERSVLARWEQGVISPPVESLLACVHACGFDLPLVLVPLDESQDAELRGSLLLPPNERVHKLLNGSRATLPARGVEGRIVAGQALAFDPYQQLAALQRHLVSFVVIGAFARVIHGTAELTEGVDITPSMREDNVARLKNGLDDLDAKRRDRKRLDLGALDQPVVALRTRAGELKLVPEPAGTRGYDDLRRHASREPLGQGVRPQVASPGDLARMLGALEQPQQLPTLLRLRRLIELERERNRGWTRER
jgi:transcriptional regulator with XRE-family HTH domain